MLHELSISQLEAQLHKKTIECSEAGIEWANSKAVYEDLDDKRKPMLASLKSYFESDKGSKVTQDFKEQKALERPEWAVFLEGLSVARKAFYQAQVRYDMAKLKIDVLRSVISARKEEIKNFRG